MHELTGDRSRRVLLVEDDQETRAALEDLLVEHGYQVSGASDGMDAFEKLKIGPAPDVILLDLRMPGMDGWEFRARQKREPSLAQTPVIAISADNTPHAEAIDAFRFLPKPINSAQLLELLVAAIDSAASAEVSAPVSELPADAQADRMAALERLAVGAANRIDNPMARLMSNLGFVAEKVEEALRAGAQGKAKLELQQASEVLRDCRDSAGRIREILQALRLFATGGEEPIGPVNLERAIEDALQRVSGELRDRARVVKHFGQVPEVRGSPARLSQVLVNLLLNATQAIRPGEVEGNQIRIGTSPWGEGQVAVEIEDTGRGIPAEVKERIFEPFFTTQPAGVRNGLGLSVCFGIVHSFGGTLTVESAPGNGSVFRVVLPVWRGEAPALPAPASEPADRPGPAARSGPVLEARNARILVIDDEPMIGKVMKRTLGNVHKVTVCLSGKEALELLDAGSSFDLIFCDLMMPGLSGADVYAEIQRRHARFAERVVFLSGGTFTQNAAAFLEAVPNPRLVKPFGVDELRDMVNVRLCRG